MTIKVIDIDIEPEEINRTLSGYFASEAVAIDFNPLYKSTIDENYESLDLEQDFDFYQNLCDAYSSERITEIIHAVIYENLSKRWVAAYFKLGMEEVDFILDYLPVYYNYIDFEGLI